MPSSTLPPPPPQPASANSAPLRPEPRRSRLAWLAEGADRRLGIVGAVLGFAVIGLAWRFSPEQYSYLPPCPLHRTTGLFCPGCGAARALHALLRGDLARAIDLNVLFVVLLPFFALVAILQFLSLVRDNQFRELPLPRWVLFSVLTAMVAFAVVRNLPFSWSRFLAP